MDEGLRAMGVAADVLRPQGNDQHDDQDVAYLRDWTMVCLASSSQALLNWGLGPMTSVRCIMPFHISYEPPNRRNQADHLTAEEAPSSTPYLPALYASPITVAVAPQ